MKFTFQQIQEAFVVNDITLEQFIQILIDNFGEKKTRKILRNNLKIAMEKEEKLGDTWKNEA